LRSSSAIVNASPAPVTVMDGPSASATPPLGPCVAAHGKVAAGAPVAIVRDVFRRSAYPLSTRPCPSPKKLRFDLASKATFWRAGTRQGQHPGLRHRCPNGVRRMTTTTDGRDLREAPLRGLPRLLREHSGREDPEGHAGTGDAHCRYKNRVDTKTAVSSRASSKIGTKVWSKSC